MLTSEGALAQYKGDLAQYKDVISQCEGDFVQHKGYLAQYSSTLAQYTGNIPQNIGVLAQKSERTEAPCRRLLKLVRASLAKHYTFEFWLIYWVRTVLN